MEEDNRKKFIRRFPVNFARFFIILLWFLFLAFMVVPAIVTPLSVSKSITNHPSDFHDIASNVHSLADTTIISAAPTSSPRVRPSPALVPARQNRTSIIQTIEKNVAERPKVMVPALWFILAVVVAFIGIGVILYFLLRSGKGPGSGPKPPSRDAGNPTVIETTSQETVKGATPHYPEPAVQFPQSLSKRFFDPVFIGEGGLARVFRAQNAKTQAIVAVKVPARFDEITGTHFTRDIVFWQGLEHKNIIRIYSFNILPIPYIEMEYAPSSLASVSLPLPEEKAVGIILGIARGLLYAHGKGIIHRDIKPENILLASDGTPKITDWGLGRTISDTRQSSVIGYSPSYAAPEQIAPLKYGRPGPATDIYQLGMLLCELLTGSVAFEAEGMHDLNMAILNDLPVLHSWNGLHENELRKIILKCLEKQPEERYKSVADLIRDLEVIRFPM